MGKQSETQRPLPWDRINPNFAEEEELTEHIKDTDTLPIAVV